MIGPGITSALCSDINVPQLVQYLTLGQLQSITFWDGSEVNKIPIRLLEFIRNFLNSFSKGILVFCHVFVLLIKGQGLSTS